MEPQNTTTEKLFNMLFKEDEITWQSLIYELIRTEQMDPWDIDVSLLTQKYIEAIKKLQEFDFIISGKVVLAAAILLNIKSAKLLEEESNIDKIIHPPEALDDEGIGYEVPEALRNLPADKITLVPRTPQPRKRKVSVFDLVEALQKALEVRKRRSLRDVVVNMPVIDRKVDITKIIFDLHKKIKAILTDKNRLTFVDLVGSEEKQDQVTTFIPLLHLDNQRKIDLMQEKQFGEIEIKLVQKEQQNDAK
ncbi:segregation/condensation protein A [Candidatus Woesearchaeota archaeon]|nr:segregation/condensation protein A [Candidatus Woesearchaeota archaeon]